MKTGITIQARMGSSRLPGKILKKVLDKPLLAYMIQRLSKIEGIDTIVVATSTNSCDDIIENYCLKEKINCYRGSEQDVLSRVLAAAQYYQLETIVQTTGDCPLIDPHESQKVIQKFFSKKYDYVSNILLRTYPRGMETQIFSIQQLEKVSRLSQNPVDREHVSYFFYQNPQIFKLGNMAAPENLKYPNLRLTVDTPQDLTLIEKIIQELYPLDNNFSLNMIIDLLKDNPSLLSVNNQIQQKAVHY